jgi:hypothetical protein
MPVLPTELTNNNPSAPIAYQNPGGTVFPYSVAGGVYSPTEAVSPVASYGMNLNYIGATMFPQIASTFAALQASLQNVDASNPAALLQVQLNMSEYENAVQSTSQMYSSFEQAIKAIIQNV